MSKNRKYEIKMVAGTLALLTIMISLMTHVNKLEALETTSKGFNTNMEVLSDMYSYPESMDSNFSNSNFSREVGGLDKYSNNEAVYSLVRNEDLINEIESYQIRQNNIKQRQIEQAEIARDRVIREKEAEKKREAIREASSSNKVANLSKGMSTGTLPLHDNISKYHDLVIKHSSTYGLDPNIIKALIAQESSGNHKSFNGHARGLMQIENVLLNEFKSYGKSKYGQNWGYQEMFDPSKNIEFGCYRFKQVLDHYNGDYIKALQGYNFSHYSLDKLINKFGDKWIENRNKMAYYNNHHKRTGRTTYGDPVYVENVLRYYKG